MTRSRHHTGICQTCRSPIDPHPLLPESIAVFGRIAN
jgi:hypothetical protein